MACATIQYSTSTVVQESGRHAGQYSTLPSISVRRLGENVTFWYHSDSSPLQVGQATYCTVVVCDVVLIVFFFTLSRCVRYTKDDLFLLTQLRLSIDLLKPDSI